MNMIKYGIKEFWRNKWFNLLVIIQITVIFVLVIFFISSVNSRLHLYLPFKDEFSSKGVEMTFNAFDYMSKTKENLTKETIINGNKNITNIVSCNYSSYIFKFEGKERHININAYESELYKRFRPLMESGRWVGEIKSEPGFINAVVTENEFGFKTGDIIDGYFDSMNSERINIKIQIIGKIKDGTRAIGTGSISTDIYAEDYRSFYKIFSYEQTSDSALFMDLDDLNRYNIFHCISGCKSLVVFQNDISEQERKETNMYLSQFGEYITTLEEINQRSLIHIWEQIYTLLPIIMGLLLLILTGLFSVNAIHTKKQFHNYAIYYINGSRWLQCGLVNTTSSVVINLVAVLLCSIFLLIGKYMYWFGDTIVTFNLYSFLGCFFVIVLNLLFSCVTPFLLIKNTNPKEVLRANE